MKELPGDIHPDFPVKIELGKKSGGPVEAPVPSTKENKDKKYYPCLYLSDIDGLEDIPKEGHALIYYRKKGASTREDDNGKIHTSADLEIEDIHFPAKEEAEEGEEMEEEMKAMMDGKEDEESESEEEESEEEESEEEDEE